MSDLLQMAIDGIEIDDPWEVARFPNAKASFPLLERMFVERGTRADWDLLHSLHYKMQSTPVGAKYWRLRYEGQTIGVIVFGMSRPLLKERHLIFPAMRPGNDTQLSNIHRYRTINDCYRVVGRLVIDTMFRSAGLAYRFINLASRQYGYQYAELQSSMSKYSFFAQRAGFTFVKPTKSLYYDKGLKFMRRYFESHPGDQEALMEEYALMSRAMQAKVERDLKAFYFDQSPLEKTGSRRFYSEGVVDAWPVRRTISKIQGLCFASPLYGIYRNPDAPVVTDKAGRDAENLPISLLPKRLPLLAFDLQPPDQPLRVSQLDQVPGWPDLERLIEDRNWSAPTVLPPGFLEAEEDADEKQDLAEELGHVHKLALTETTLNGETPA